MPPTAIQTPNSKLHNVPSPCRSLLFVPGDSERKLEKAATLPVDTLILDLEDGVALNRKAEARQTVVNALATLDFGRRERLVRINALDTELALADLTTIAPARPDGYVIAKVETPEQLHLVDQQLAHAAPLWAMIETARGVMNLREIAAATPHLVGLIFGSEDFAADVGAQRTRAGWELFYARSAIVTAAAVYGLHAIDMIFVDLTDLAGLEEECRQGRQLGFVGKTAIHPRQVDVINRVFAPAPAEVLHARRVVQAYEQHQAAGVGAFELDGKMVDQPVVRAARRVLARARE
jgi:citrate lyase beta subunit